MRQLIGVIMAMVVLLVAQSVFADDTSSSMQDTSFKPCKMIAKACIQAGYGRKDKEHLFWKDCMQPILLNQTVQGVQLSANDVKACRDFKITQMEKELTQLKSVK